jgi:hypothetical protein
VPLHHYIWWRYHKQRIGRGFVLHHKDENKTSNKASNLQRMTIGKHTTLHMTGRPCSELTRTKMSASSKGKAKSPEHCAAISAAKKNPSQETRDRISAANRRRSPEVIAKIAASNTGKKMSAKTRAKMSAASKGKQKSIATRAKMSAAMVKRHAHYGKEK